MVQSQQELLFGPSPLLVGILVQGLCFLSDLFRIQKLINEDERKPPVIHDYCLDLSFFTRKGHQSSRTDGKQRENFAK